MKRSLARFRLSLLRASALAQVSIAVSAARCPGSSRKFRPSVIMQRTSVDGRKLIVQDLGKTQALLVLITAAALAPFLNKAFHIDDPLFLWMAQQIAKHPFDPYGFDVNWSSFTQPMSVVMQNPPLCSYYIAAIGSIFGWSEISLHAAFLFWATMSILGTFALAQRVCGLEGRAPAGPASQELAPRRRLHAGGRPPDKRANTAPFQAAL